MAIIRHWKRFVQPQTSSNFFKRENGRTGDWGENSFFLWSGVEGREGFLEVIIADVGVAVCGGHAGVTEHFLDDTQICENRIKNAIL